VTDPVIPVDGYPPVSVEDTVVELPILIGEETAVVIVGVALLTTNANAVCAWDAV
jgi:hypothetical protein